MTWGPKMAAGGLWTTAKPPDREALTPFGMSAETTVSDHYRRFVDESTGFTRSNSVVVLDLPRDASDPAVDRDSVIGLCHTRISGERAVENASRSRNVVIIPAKDEHKTVGGVVEACLASPLISEVVVVANGSRDKTPSIARFAGARVLELPTPGKGEAMVAGARELSTTCDVVLFMDADLIGVTSEHIESLIAPVVSGELDMTCGILRGRWRGRSWIFRLFPTLTGQRAMRIGTFLEIQESDMHGYNVEAAINRHCGVNRLRVKRLPLDDVTHIRKEDKGPMVKGKIQKYLMILRVYVTYARLICRQIRRPAKISIR